MDENKKGSHRWEPFLFLAWSGVQRPPLGPPAPLDRGPRRLLLGGRHDLAGGPHRELLQADADRALAGDDQQAAQQHLDLGDVAPREGRGPRVAQGVVRHRQLVVVDGDEVVLGLAVGHQRHARQRQACHRQLPAVGADGLDHGHDRQHRADPGADPGGMRAADGTFRHFSRHRPPC